MANGVITLQNDVGPESGAAAAALALTQTRDIVETAALPPNKPGPLTPTRSELAVVAGYNL